MCEQVSLAWRRTALLLKILSYGFKREQKDKSDQDIDLIEDLMMLMFLSNDVADVTV